MIDLKRLKRVNRSLASIRLAVVTILSLAIIAAIGTFTEAHYNDSEMATKLVYQSPWMYAVPITLVVTLIAVMIDRWPWKQHHTGFVLAHIGIITLLFGAWLTQRYGVDGTVMFDIGQDGKHITVKERDIMVWGAVDGSTELKGLFQAPVEFLRRPPTPEHPYLIQLGKDELKILEHLPFAFRETEITPTKLAGDPPAVRIQLQNANVNMTQWLRGERGKPSTALDLGPAKIILASEEPKPSGRNEVILVWHPDAEQIDYVIFNKDKTLRNRGHVRQSEAINTGWMALEVRLLRYLPHSAETVHFSPASYSTPMTTSAMHFTLAGGDYWAGLDAPLRIFMSDRAYVIVYGHRQIPLAFPLRLKAFRMGKYQGTDRASSYESTVEVPGRGDIVISMNEPLKQDGYTFYQSSYEQNDKGETTVSILSVNYDPGRWVKYLGSLLIIAGSIVLFYFKRVQWRKTKRGTT